MTDKIDKLVEDMGDKFYNQAVDHCKLILEAEYQKMNLSKANTYCSGRIKHLIDSLEKLKSTK